MPTGLRGSSFTVAINTGTTEAPEWTPIANGTTYDRSSTRSVSEVAVFGDAETLKSKGARSTTVSLEFIRKLDDEGQNAFLAALADEGEDSEQVELQVMYDEETGYQQLFQINDTGETADPAEFQRVTYTLSPIGDREEVGAES